MQSEEKNLEDGFEILSEKDGPFLSDNMDLSKKIALAARNSLTNLGFMAMVGDDPFWKGLHETDIITLLGMQYTLNHLKPHYEELIWFSYRKNFQNIRIPESKDSINADTSWGCAIRSCQMMFSTIIMKLFKSRGVSTKNLREDVLK